MYIPTDAELEKLVDAVNFLQTFIDNMLESEDYSVENDCELAEKLIIANDKIFTTLTYFNIRKRERANV